MFPCNKGCTERAHDTCDIRTDSFASCDLFKASKDSIIIECTTLNNDITTQFRSIRYLDNLEKGILYNRISKTSGDIRYLCTFLLCLLYLGIHKYSTTCSKINRMLCKKSCFCKILYAVIQRLGKCLNERTTA